MVLDLRAILKACADTDTFAVKYSTFYLVAPRIYYIQSGTTGSSDSWNTNVQHVYVLAAAYR